jgi:hypothetical protein
MSFFCELLHILRKLDYVCGEYVNICHILCVCVCYFVHHYSLLYYMQTLYIQKYVGTPSNEFSHTH